MPAIWTFGSNNTTGIDLSANAFWRLTLGAAVSSHTSWLALAMIYPPGPGQTILQTQITLARSPISVTDKSEDIQRLAEVSVSMGSLEKDKERMTEAFNLFKNTPRVRQDVLEADLRGGLEILTAYWSIRDWLFAGAKEDQSLVVGAYAINLKA